MIYYIKQGQSSIWCNIKLLENECQIPGKISNFKKKKKEKVVKKIKKKKIDKVVLDKTIKEDKEFIEQLNNYDITILDGKWLMNFLLQDIIEYLKEKRKIETSINEITILSNDLTNEVLQNIKRLANTYKKIRIVTNHIEKFKKIERELYEEQGITIIITNNKRKALSKSLLIINFDFVEETINQYNINENAIIINLNEKIRINKKRFSGCIVTDYEVEIKEIKAEYKNDILNIQDILEKEGDFCLKEILEEKIYSNMLKYNELRSIEKILKEYNVEIKKLYGIRGILL